MAEESLITEQMRNAVGNLVNVSVKEIDKTRIETYLMATGDSNPLFRDSDEARGSRYVGPIVPPGLIITMQMEGESPGFYMDYMLHLKGAIDAGGSWEFFKPVREGDILVVDRKLVDINEKKGSLGNMLFCRFETTYRNQREEIVAKGNWQTIRFLAPEVDDYEGKKIG
jgi:acyl dehydratase